MNDLLKIWMALGAVMVVSAFVYYPSPVFSQTAAEVQPVEYVIEDIQGPDVQVLEEGSKTWVAAQEGQVVESGDQVKTGNNSQATLTLESDTTVHLDPNSTVKVDQIAPNETGGFLSRLEMIAGNLLADVKKNLQDSHSTFEINANGVVCGVRGTAFEVGWDGNDLRTATHEGKVEVLDKDHVSHFVEAGNASTFNKGHFRLQRRLEPREMARFQQWRQFRKNVFQKRLQRLQAIREHRRPIWQRHTPHPGGRPSAHWGQGKRKWNPQRPERRFEQ
jgi:ferric-dicitrate binding protein FerR (iron transport regulator)